MKRLLWLLPFFLVGIGGVVLLKAGPFKGRSFRPVIMQTTQPDVWPLSASPTLIFAASPTKVTFTTLVTSPSIINAGIHLVRVDSSGASSVVGTFHDDGANGDQHASDSIYTFQITLAESGVGEVRFYAASPLVTRVRRLQSNIATISVATSTPSNTVGPAGGSVVLTSGVSLNFPPGALTGSISINATTVEAQYLNAGADLGVAVRGAVDVRVLPASGSGRLTPQSRFSLTVPLYSALPPGSQLSVITHNPAGDDWIETDDTATVTTDGRSATTQIRFIGVVVLVDPL